MRRTVGSVILAQPAVYFFIVVEHPLPLSAARQYLFQFAADVLHAEGLGNQFRYHLAVGYQVD